MHRDLHASLIICKSSSTHFSPYANLITVNLLVMMLSVPKTLHSFRHCRECAQNKACKSNLLKGIVAFYNNWKYCQTPREIKKEKIQYLSFYVFLSILSVFNDIEVLIWHGLSNDKNVMHKDCNFTRSTKYMK